jgi:hypothetical protein
MNTRNLVGLSIAAALSLLSCGDAVPPPAEGAAGLNVKNSGDATVGNGCSSPHLIVLGAAAPTPGDPGATWTDGHDGHRITCSVTGNGTFTVNGTITGPGENFRVDGKATAGETGPASVAFFDPMQTTALSDKNCTMRVDGSYTVEKGAVWAAVSCSHMVSDDDPHIWCALDASFVFKNCAD